MAASLPSEPDDLLITDELHHRIAHKADYQREKLAIQDLARQMAEQPDQVLPRLVHLAMELCGGQSAGISLYEAQPPGPGIFRWHHLAGRYANFSGGTVPRDFSPSGVCFDVDHPILMARPERVYDFLSEAGVPNYEVLLVPLYAGQPDPLGTLWVISHDEAIHFDSGDARVTTELAAFAGLALKMIQDASVLRASEERLNVALHQQEMLTREMSHRVKNLFAIAIGMVSISAKSAATAQDMAKTLLGRLNALARAHDLVLRGLHANGQIIREATLTRLLEAIFQPHTDLARTGDPKRIVISGPDLVIGERALTSLALVLHELATNAAKYGALSIGQGLVHVTWQIRGWFTSPGRLKPTICCCGGKSVKGLVLKRRPPARDLVASSSAAASSVSLAANSTTSGSPRGFLPLFRYRWNVSQAERLLLCHPKIVGKHRPWERCFPWERCVAESNLGIDCRKRAVYRSRSRHGCRRSGRQSNRARGKRA